MPVFRLTLAALLCTCLSGCLVRHRTLPPPGRAQNRPLLTATKEDLIGRIRSVSDPIRAFSLQTDLSPSVGSLYGGQLTDYATIRAYVLFRRPDDIRVVGLDPVVHTTTIFDMVSTGNSFRVSIPSKELFYIGDNTAPPSSKNKLENLRPTAFLTAMIIEPPAIGDLTVLEDDTDATQALYELLLLRNDGGNVRLLRSVFFDRYSLEIVRQRTFDNSGAIVSDTAYSDWREYNDIPFPSLIVIRRPKEGYELTINVISARFNPTDMPAQQFVLEQPPRAKVVEIK